LGGEFHAENQGGRATAPGNRDSYFVELGKAEDPPWMGFTGENLVKGRKRKLVLHFARGGKNVARTAAMSRSGGQVSTGERTQRRKHRYQSRDHEKVTKNIKI